MTASDTHPTLPQIRADLLRLMSEVLGQELPESIPDDLPILEFVVSSLALVEGMRRIYEHFGVLISIRRVIEGQLTLGGIALYVEQELRAPSRKSTLLAGPEAASTLLPARRVKLAPSQQHLAFLARYSSEAAAAFNEAVAVRLEGALDGPALQAALESVVGRYEALQTALSPDQDELNIQSGQPLALIVSQCPAAQLDQRLSEIVSRPFSPGERLFHAELLRLPEEAGAHVLVIVSHALVVESEALQIVLEELAAYYSAYAQNQEPALGFPALQWTDYVAMGQTDIAIQAQQSAQEFWQQTFSEDWPHLELPGDQPRPPVKRYSGARQSLSLEPELVAQLHGFAQSQNLTIADVIFSAYGLYLSRLSNQPDLVVGIRSAPLYLDTGQRVVAQTRNMLPARTGIDRQRSFIQQGRALAAALADAEEHRHLSLAEMIQLLNPARDQSRSPLFTAAFQHHAQTALPAFASLQTSFIQAPAAGARYDIDLTVLTTTSGVDLVCDYSTELFEPETIARWLNGLATLLRAGLENPETACAVLPLLPADERRKLLHDWNRTEQEYPKDKTVLDLFVAQALAHPAAPAVRFNETILTYDQLLKRVEALAALLASQGVSTGDRVGILLERSPDLLAALLAVWRVGALYVPLDQSFPRKRLAYMLEDSGVKVLLTHSGGLGARDWGLGVGVSTICLDTDWPSITEPLAPNPQSPIPDPQPLAPESSAYIIYTSGSTGQPKGVEVGHQGLVNCLLAVQSLIGFKAGAALLAITTVSFDIATVELFMPLLVGGLVDIAPDGVVADGVRLAEMIAAHQPDYMQATPSTWKTLLVAGWQGEAHLSLASAGESLSRTLAEQLLSRGRELWDLYGPTETTVYSTISQVESAPGQPVPVGRPIANTQIYILDDQHQPVPLGAVGELYIGGDGVARGYWGRPELTAERFIPNPFVDTDDEGRKTKDERSGLRPSSFVLRRLYKTGDFARYLPDGTLLCLGRIDVQVKIHGVRMELGEVETALRALPGIRDAVVTAWRDARGDMQLVGHIIAAISPAPSVAELRAQLRDRLPEVMIPPYFLFSEAFPLPANGKIRPGALPTPEAIHSGSTAPLEMPETPSEQLLAEAWTRVLGIEPARIGRDSDFIDLGGHSLLMTPLMLEVRKLFGVRFNLREFFGASTLRALAGLIDERSKELSKNRHDRAPRTTGPIRTAEWGRQRMAFLLREAQLPAILYPARGLTYQPSEINKVFMTGGTGFLGVYLIAEILRTTRAHLYCLARPKRGEDSKSRIEKQMRRYDVWRNDEQWQADWDTRLHVVEGDVTLPRLGMADSAYETLAREVDAILHGAAHVNFIYPYEALRATNVLGLHEIIRFAFHARLKPVHHLSTAAIWPMGAQYTFYEKDSIEHGQVLNLGYDEAKWVGERCLLYAEERGLPVARYRPGEVGGDSVTGRCVTDHFVVACVKGFLQFGAFPLLDMELDVAPIDYVARAMTYIMFHRQPFGRAFHLTNPYRQHLSEALAFLRSRGYRFEEVPFVELRDRLFDRADFVSNGLVAYQAALEDMDDISLQLPTYDTRETERELRGSGITCAPADEKLFGLYLAYLQQIGFMPQPSDLHAVPQVP